MSTLQSTKDVYRVLRPFTRFVFVCLVALGVIAVSQTSVAVAEDTREEYFDFEVVGPTITINGYDGPDGEVRIPRTIMGLPVTRISEWFSGCSGVTSITIPDSVTIIEGGAFSGCTSSLTLIEVDAENAAYSSLDGVLFEKHQEELIVYPRGRTGHYTIPDNVVSIRDDAFADCTSLTSITIPDSVTSIGNYAFWGCTSLTSIVIADSVTSIGNYAFWGCTGLEGVTIGNGLTSIEDWTFSGCTSMTSVTIGRSVTSIGWGTFSGCTGLTSINVHADNPAFSSIDGVLFDKSQETLIECPQGKAGNYRVPDGVVTIGGSAFFWCTGLTSIVIPESALSIGGSAFAGCTGLESLTIGNGVTSIGNGAFARCTSLTSVRIGSGVTNIDKWLFRDSPSLESIEVSSDNPAYSSFEGVLLNSNGQHLIWCPQGKVGSYRIPNGVVTIGNGAFSDCVGLNSVVIPDSVTSIGEGAFAGCASLTTVVIPDSVTSIGWSAFTGCASLTTVTIGSSVTSIGNFAFWGCPILAGVYFYGARPIMDLGVDPDGLMGVQIFQGSDNVTIYYLPGAEGWGSTLWGRPTALWILPPTILTGGDRFGVQPEGFTLTISWATEDPIVVEAITDLGGSEWTTLFSGTVAGGSVEITDPEWAEHRARFYRVRVP